MHVGSAISGNSSFNNIVAFAGGRGSAYGYWVADNGGSGGGSGRNAIIPGTGTVGQGYDGGIGDEGPEYLSGGGGGAGGMGVKGIGGIGKQSSISGTTKYYAGGGSGGRYLDTSIVAAGLGGGGEINQPGIPNTGGGGGGATTHIGLSDFPAGGTGIVIIRYLT